MHNGFPDVSLTYAVPVLLALLLGLLFPVARHLTARGERRQYYQLQLITFLSAIVGAKLVFLFGDHGWPFRPIDDWSAVMYSGRSIVGALIFGLLGAELAKPFVNYSLPPNDRFAALLTFSIAVGRIGCLMSGCCRGAPTESPLAIVYGDGIPRHPAQIYEMLFHATAGIVAILLIKKKRLQGCVFSLYLMAYGVFRLLTELIRETPQQFGLLTSYQWLSLAMIGLGAGFLVKRTYYPSQVWQRYFAPETQTAP